MFPHHFRRRPIKRFITLFHVKIVLVGQCERYSINLIFPPLLCKPREDILFQTKAQRHGRKIPCLCSRASALNISAPPRLCVKYLRAFASPRLRVKYLRVSALSISALPRLRVSALNTSAPPRLCVSALNISAPPRLRASAFPLPEPNGFAEGVDIRFNDGTDAGRPFSS